MGTNQDTGHFDEVVWLLAIQLAQEAGVVVEFVGALHSGSRAVHHAESDRLFIDDLRRVCLSRRIHGWVEGSERERIRRIGTQLNFLDRIFNLILRRRAGFCAFSFGGQIILGRD